MRRLGLVVAFIVRQAAELCRDCPLTILTAVYTLQEEGPSVRTRKDRPSGPETQYGDVLAHKTCCKGEVCHL